MVMEALRRGKLTEKALRKVQVEILLLLLEKENAVDLDFEDFRPEGLISEKPEKHSISLPNQEVEPIINEEWDQWVWDYELRLMLKGLCIMSQNGFEITGTIGEKTESEHFDFVHCCYGCKAPFEDDEDDDDPEIQEPREKKQKKDDIG